MEQLVFKDATINDLPVIVEIYNSTVAGRMVTADIEPVSVESRKQWFYEHNPSVRPLWIIENASKEIVGWVSFQDFYGRVAYSVTAEISIYLNESKRGKGFGKTVLRYSIDNCYRLSIKNLVGFIFAHNEPSLKLFAELGFEDWGCLPNVAVLDGVERSLKILGRRV
ncbi:MAG: phosphinothricin acetyltransferase [Segetibacter sp.]|nr:phosphinothricin acetyltransferase [Segetibacter sp.]